AILPGTTAELTMRGAPRTLTNEINVTPFLDVLLVLLVIFLASVQARRTLDVSLPVPSESACVADCESIVLEVLPGGRFALNKSDFAGPDLPLRIHAAFDGRPTSVLFVKGHPSARYQDVVTAIDVARGAGVQVLAIAPKQLR
ncbi:MAG: ExbD/TolR family protein, partial [Gemmatimonadaceae bacterium]